MQNYFRVFNKIKEFMEHNERIRLFKLLIILKFLNLLLLEYRFRHPAERKAELNNS